jgi:hypothetical protein
MESTHRQQTRQSLNEMTDRELLMEIASKLRAFEDAIATVQTNGVMGAMLSKMMGGAQGTMKGGGK